MRWRLITVQCIFKNIDKQNEMVLKIQKTANYLENRRGLMLKVALYFILFGEFSQNREAVGKLSN